MIGLAGIVALGLLFLWARDRAKDVGARRLERELNCPHRPEWQETLRVGREHPMVRHLIPGARWVVKRCRGCGRQRPLYRPQLQPWDEYEREYRQETADREAEYAARKHWHDIEEKGRHEKDRVRSPDRRDRGAGSAP